MVYATYLWWFGGWFILVLPTLIVFSNQWQLLMITWDTHAPWLFVDLIFRGIHETWVPKIWQNDGNIWTISLLFIKYGKANGFDGRVKQCNDEESTGHPPLKQRNTTCFGLEISKTALCSQSDAFLTLWHRTIYNSFFFRTCFCTYRCSYLFAEVVIAPRTTISCTLH